MTVPSTPAYGRRAVRPFGFAKLPAALLCSLAFVSAPAIGRAGEPGKLLWEIGKRDGENAELALAPGGYRDFREDAFFVVGRSDPKRDWPYVQPGPADGWAEGRPHTFTIVFGLRAAPAAGDCRLVLDLVDTQGQIPPALLVEIGGKSFERALPKGAGDASVSGDPKRGKEHLVELTFPSSLLRAGTNAIDITTRTGSWILYDWVGLETPPGAELDGAAGGTALSALRAPSVLVERNGRLMQPLRASIRHFGPEAKGSLRVQSDGGGDLATVELALVPGQKTVEVLVPAVEAAALVEAGVEIEGQAVATRTTTLRPVRRWVVYLLPHSHVDIGYTHVQTDVERAQWKFLEMAIEAARKSADNPPGSRFKWNVEVLWAVDGYLRQATPEKREAFFDAVAAGQVGIDALYGNMLTGLPSGEELLRLLRLGPEIAKRTGVPVESAMITDVPGYTWGIVPAFASTGVKYFSIGPNGGDRIGHTIAAWGDKPFWWIGPNGKDRVLVWMTGTGYYRVFSSAENLTSYLGRLESQGYPYDYVQVRHCLGDNGAPDVDFADTVRKWNEAHAYPKLVIATTAEMFRDFEKRYGAAIPVAKGDFTPYWEDGAGSSARETALNRASAARLVQAETFCALLAPKAYTVDDFSRAWRNVILYDEHTWGAYNSISEPDHPFVKSQWAIKQSFALEGDRGWRAILEKANASRGERPVLPAGASGDLIDVVDTTGGSHPHALVVVPRELSRAGDRVRPWPLQGDAAIPSQRLSTGELVFRQGGPGYASRRFLITGDPPAAAGFAGATAEGTTLRTSDAEAGDGLTVRVDEATGGIASLVRSGHELVDRKAGTALNDYFYLPGSDLAGLQRNGPVRISVKERGPLVASLLVESDAPGCNRLTREVRVHALRQYVEIIDTVDKKAVRAKEGVHFGFAFDIPGGTMRMEVPWAVVRPEADQIPGACKNWFTVQGWVDISGPSRGVTWITPDAPLVQVGGITANLIGSLSDPKAWIERLEPSQTFYSWAMNNHWHTNYVAEQSGPTVFRYYIVPHAGGFDAGRAVSLGREFREPLLVVPARGELPEEPPVRVSCAGESRSPFALTAFKPSDDGKALILRIHNPTEKARRATVEWRRVAPRSVWLSDTTEEPRGPAGETVEVPALSFVTLRADLP